MSRRTIALGAGLCSVLLIGAAPAANRFGFTPVADAPVADAAMRSDTARVRMLIKQGADVNAAQGDGMTRSEERRVGKEC